MVGTIAICKHMVFILRTVARMEQPLPSSTEAVIVSIIDAIVRVAIYLVPMVVWSSSVSVVSITIMDLSVVDVSYYLVS